MEGQREVLPYVLEFVALDAKGRSATQIHDPSEAGARRGSAGIDRKTLRQLPFNTGRKMSKKGKVGRHAIALHRIMGAAQPFEPGEILVAE